MQGLCYSALDIAVIVSSMQLGCRDESRILDRIRESEKAFLEMIANHLKENVILQEVTGTDF